MKGISKLSSFLFVSVVVQWTAAFRMPHKPLPLPSSQPLLATNSKDEVIKPLPSTAAAPPLATSPPQKIALMVEPTPFTYVCGYSNRFNEMLRYLEKAGDNVSILTTDDTPSPPKSAFGYPIATTLGFRFPLYSHVCVSFDLPELKGLRLMEKFRPDIIHITSPGFMLFAALIYARVMRVPLVMSYHTHLPNYAVKYLGYIPRIEDFAWFLIRFAHSRADLTLTTSPQLKAELEAKGIKRVDVWRKGVDVVRFNPDFEDADMRSRMTEGNPDDFLMVYVGRLGAEKRCKDILPILGLMGSRARLAVVGDGPQAEELRAHFEGTNTLFMGQLSGDELSQAFASADAFVMPSDSETLGFVVLESMASGTPVVAARAGGIPHIVDHEKTSFLAETGDAEEFAKYLRMLRDDKGLRDRMRQAGREEVSKHSWEAATSVLRNVQYPLARQNFKTRSFNGYGGVGSRFLGRVWRIKVMWAWSRVKWLIRQTIGGGALRDLIKEKKA
mmetsp:Transcript_14668/g.29914  ORF Transcript_14668/g.29914 Transcript_14668/m.29914 type:complete len:500 (+) Transcript_14668:229-1728(+)